MKNMKYIIATLVALFLGVSIFAFNKLVLNKKPSTFDGSIDNIIEEYQDKTDAKKILVSLIDSKTGRVIYINDKQTAASYVYTPDSALIPILLSVALDSGVINQKEKIFMHNEGKPNKDGFYPSGEYDLGLFPLKARSRYLATHLNFDDIFVYRSIIGSSKIANRLSDDEFYHGFLKFGFNSKTDFGLDGEHKGNMYDKSYFKELNSNSNVNALKSLMSFGGNIEVSFLQLLQAYNVFNNGGNILSPYLIVPNGKSHRVLNIEDSFKIKNLLTRFVNERLNLYSNTFDIGGYTVTNRIFENHQYSKKDIYKGASTLGTSSDYSNKYNDSFFGFINTSNKKYTIGILIIEGDKKRVKKQSPEIFKEIISKLGLLSYSNQMDFK